MNIQTFRTFEPTSGHDAVQIKIDDWGSACPTVSVRHDGDSIIISVKADTCVYTVYRYTGEFWMVQDRVRKPIGYTADDYVAEHPEFTAREIKVSEELLYVDEK